MNLTDREQRIQTICLLVLSTIAVAAALYWLRPILIPFILAVFFALGLAPIAQMQTRVLRIPSGLAVLSTLILLSIGLMFVGGLISSSVKEVSANSADYQEQITATIERLRDVLPLEQLGLEDPETDFDPFSIIPTQSITSFLAGTTNAILDLFSQSFIVMIFTFFLLAGSTGKTSTGPGVRSEIEAQIKSYIVKQTLISAVTGLLVWIILASLGVDLALVFGLFTFLLNFIPNVGSVLAVLLPLPVVLVSPDISTTVAILAIALPAVVQMVIGNIITPKVMGDALDLHPVTILLALMFWGALWGFVGMLLATPITAILKILMQRFDVTEPVSQVLAGRFGVES
ncbi:MAG: AI-2 transport protein TqsA [Myxococcota bacterium]|jgi:AI-2 transport protein TqsA